MSYNLVIELSPEARELLVDFPLRKAKAVHAMAHALDEQNELTIGYSGFFPFFLGNYAAELALGFPPGSSQVGTLFELPLQQLMQYFWTAKHATYDIDLAYALPPGSSGYPNLGTITGSGEASSPLFSLTPQQRVAGGSMAFIDPLVFDGLAATFNGTYNHSPSDPTHPYTEVGAASLTWFNGGQQTTNFGRPLVNFDPTSKNYSTRLYWEVNGLVDPGGSLILIGSDIYTPGNQTTLLSDSIFHLQFNGNDIIPPSTFPVYGQPGLALSGSFTFNIDQFWS
jgi:hypothetical protein